MDEINRESINDENMAGVVEGSEANTPTTPEMGKKPGDKMKIIIPAAVLVVLVFVLVGVAVVTGVLGDKRKEIRKALGETFAQSVDAIGEAWKLDGYKGMFAEKQMSIEADLTIADVIQMEMELNKDEELCGVNMWMGYYGIPLAQADAYVSTEEIMVGLPNLTDYVFYVDRESFNEDIDKMVSETGLDVDIADYLKAFNEGSRELDYSEEDMAIAVRQCRDAILDIFEKAEISKADSKRLMVNGQERSCRGYLVTITGRQFADVVLDMKDIYDGNEAFRNYINGILMGIEGYSSVEELLEFEDPSDGFLNIADELEKESDTEIYFYLYKGVIAQVYCKDEDVSLEWNIQGGNFPLENMELKISTGYSEDIFTRSGSNNGGKYQAEYVIQSDYEELTFAAQWEKERGDFRFNFDDGYSTMFLKGNIDETQKGAEFTISIDEFEVDDEEILVGDISISNECGDIKKPEGEAVDVLDLTEDDWYEIIWEISNNLY